MTKTQIKLMRQAARDPADKGTQWRDRMDAWMDELRVLVGYTWVLPKNYRCEFAKQWAELRANPERRRARRMDIRMLRGLLGDERKANPLITVYRKGDVAMHKGRKLRCVGVGHPKRNLTLEGQYP